MSQLRVILRTASYHAKKCLHYRLDASVGIFIIIDGVDGVWALLVRGRGVGASDVCGSRSCREVDRRGLRLIDRNLDGRRVQRVHWGHRWVQFW